jgi:hypothetical protein
MAARIGVTVAALLLALIAFMGGGPAAPGLLNPFGLLFLFLALLAWFAWDAIVGGYASFGSGEGGAELPLLARFGPVFIKGITSLGQPRRHRPAASPPAEPKGPASQP